MALFPALQRILLSRAARRPDTASLVLASRMSVALALFVALVVEPNIWWLVPLVFGSAFQDTVPLALILVVAMVLWGIGQSLSGLLIGVGHPGRASLTDGSVLLLLAVCLVPLVHWERRQPAWWSGSPTFWPRGTGSRRTAGVPSSWWLGTSWRHAPPTVSRPISSTARMPGTRRTGRSPSCPSCEEACQAPSERLLGVAQGGRSSVAARKSPTPTRGFTPWITASWSYTTSLRAAFAPPEGTHFESCTCTMMCCGSTRGANCETLGPCRLDRGRERLPGRTCRRGVACTPGSGPQRRRPQLLHSPPPSRSARRPRSSSSDESSLRRAYMLCSLHPAGSGICR